MSAAGTSSGVLEGAERQAAERLIEKTKAEAEKNAQEMAAKAKYKIQVFFRSTRSLHRPVAYTISVWESGKRLHGGGDEMMFFCRRQPDAPKPDRFEVSAARLHGADPKGCGKPFSGGLVVGDVVVCPHCGARHKPYHVGDSIFYRTSIDKAADIIAKLWRQLEHSADIYVKYHPQDIRVLTMSRGFSARKARELKGLTIYPLERIIKDTAHGVTIESRFKALLLA
jgi:hypothetical protein